MCATELNTARASTRLRDACGRTCARAGSEDRHVHRHFIDIVEKGFDAGVRLGESVHRDMVAVPLGGPITIAVVASQEYLRRVPAPRHPDELVRHNCVRLRFAGTGMIYKWEFQVDGRLVEYEVKGNLTLSDTLFSLDAALQGIGLAYTFEQLARPYIRAKRLKRVLASFSPTFPGLLPVLPPAGAISRRS